ncbi:MAG TPA: outer membrane beta-barrel protein [Hansschlegelia sp.]
MARRRAISASLMFVAAMAAAGHARAQTAEQRQQAAQQADANLADQQQDAPEPLRRLDPSQLAGGDYGGAEPAPLAGGDYGTQLPTETDTAAPLTGPIGDPLAAGPAGIQPRSRPTPGFEEDDAYAPTGVRAGAFILRPSMEAAGGYDDNPDRVEKGGKGSPFVRLKGALDARSDWERHEVDVKIDGQARRYTDTDRDSYEPNVNAVIDGRLDVTERTKITSELRASITSSRPGDADTATGLKGDEIQKSAGATLGVSQTFNRFSLKLEGLVDRYVYNDAKLQDGSTLDNSDRAYNSYEIRLRGAYDLSPRLKPFAEVALDTRDYDKSTMTSGLDENGNPVTLRRRNGSSGYAIRGGATFEATRLITGELAVGYGRQNPKDKDLKPVDGLLIDGSVAWSPSALTTVRATARTALQETTLEGSGGVLGRSFGVEVEHRLRRNFIVTARADFERQSYRGIGRVDDGLTLALETEYRLNRSLSLIGSFEHERLDSNAAGADYKASIVEVGMRVRR